MKTLNNETERAPFISPRKKGEIERANMRQLFDILMEGVQKGEYGTAEVFNDLRNFASDPDLVVRKLAELTQADHAEAH